MKWNNTRTPMMINISGDGELLCERRGESGDECEGVVAEGESHADGLGVEGKVLVCHKSHGVAQV